MQFFSQSFSKGTVTCSIVISKHSFLQLQFYSVLYLEHFMYFGEHFSTRSSSFLTAPSKDFGHILVGSRVISTSTVLSIFAV